MGYATRRAGGALIVAAVTSHPAREFFGDDQKDTSSLTGNTPALMFVVITFPLWGPVVGLVMLGRLYDRCRARRHAARQATARIVPPLVTNAEQRIARDAAFVRAYGSPQMNAMQCANEAAAMRARVADAFAH